jgi:hypothetical protein
MDKTVLDIIKKQTDISDDLLIERVYYESGNDPVKTITTLSNIEIIKTKDVPHTVFDDIRKIVDEKEKIYYNRNKGI